VRPPRRLLAAAAAALLLLGLASVSLTALRQPMAGGDYVAIWGLKARALHRAGTLDALFRVDPEGAFSHPEYPPLWPLLLSGSARLAGRYDELPLGLWWPLLCAGAATAAAVATRAPVWLRLCTAAALALLPYYRTPLYVGYAEALLVALVLWGIALLDRDATYAAAALLALAAWAKQEGALAGIVIAACLLVARRRRAAAAVGAGVLLGSVIPWQLAVAARLPQGPARDFAPSAFEAGKLVAAARVLASEAVVPHLAWILGGALLLAMAPQVRAGRRGFLAGVAIYAALLFLSFAFTVRDVAWHVHWTWDRLALLPLAVLLPVLAEAAGEAAAVGQE